eukprot:gene6544-biopygen22391
MGTLQPGNLCARPCSAQMRLSMADASDTVPENNMAKYLTSKGWLAPPASWRSQPGGQAPPASWGSRPALDLRGLWHAPGPGSGTNPPKSNHTDSSGDTCSPRSTVAVALTAAGEAGAWLSVAPVPTAAAPSGGEQGGLYVGLTKCRRGVGERLLEGRVERQILICVGLTSGGGGHEPARALVCEHLAGRTPLAGRDLLADRGPLAGRDPLAGREHLAGRPPLADRRHLAGREHLTSRRRKGRRRRPMAIGDSLCGQWHAPRRSVGMMQWSEVEGSSVEWSGGVEWSGVEWSEGQRTNWRVCHGNSYVFAGITPKRCEVAHWKLFAGMGTFTIPRAGSANMDCCVFPARLAGCGSPAKSGFCGPLPNTARYRDTSPWGWGRGQPLRAVAPLGGACFPHSRLRLNGLNTPRNRSVIRKWSPPPRQWILGSCGLPAILTAGRWCTLQGAGAHSRALVHTSWRWCTLHGAGAHFIALVHTSWRWCTLHSAGAHFMALVHTSWRWCTLHGAGAHFIA